MAKPSHSLNGQPYHVQKVAAPDTLRNNFPYFPFHESVSGLWDQLWREDCRHGIYPFGEGDIADFEPAFQKLIEISNDDPRILHDPDRYAEPFLPIGRNLVAQAEKAETEQRFDNAKNLFLRASAVFRIARFPIPRTPFTRSIWEESKAAHVRGAKYMKPAPLSVDIPFVDCNISAGDADAPIPSELWIPEGQKPAGGWPVLVFIGGIDGYRIDTMIYVVPHVQKGLATLTFDCPGTGDNPCAPNDPIGADRWISSIVTWVKAHANVYNFDLNKLLMHGVSCGGYYGMRAAHTHAKDFLGVVAQGGCAHYVFDPTWIANYNQMEFAMAMLETMAYKFGFRGGDGIEKYTAESWKFSLWESGLLGKETCRLLIINGMEDSLWPIEDCMLVAMSGANIDLHVNNRQHMGEPEAASIVTLWLDQRVASGK